MKVRLQSTLLGNINIRLWEYTFIIFLILANEQQLHNSSQNQSVSPISLYCHLHVIHTEDTTFLKDYRATSNVQHNQLIGNEYRIM